ncbi:MAG: four helix bundle protein [Candidatus Aminicenantia bacterium]
MKNLEDLEVYKLAEDLADSIWDICIGWDYFSKDTIGKELVKAADSICANIAEGFGRFHYKENINFLYFARGSLEETRDWLRRASRRDLLNEEEFKLFQEKIDKIGKKLNSYINSIKKQFSGN